MTQDVYVSFVINLTIHRGCFNRPRSFKNLLKIGKKISSNNHVMHNNTICKPIINLMYMKRRYHDLCLCMVFKCRNNTFGDFCRLCVSPSWKMWTLLCPMSFVSQLKQYVMNFWKVILACHTWHCSCVNGVHHIVVANGPLQTFCHWFSLVLIGEVSNIPQLVVCVSIQKKVEHWLWWQMLCTNGMILFFAPFDLCFLL